MDPQPVFDEFVAADGTVRQGWSSLLDGLDEFADTMRSRIVSIFSDPIASAKVPVLDVASRYTELGEALLPVINPAVSSKYGFMTTQPTRAETNATALRFAMGIAGAASRESCKSSLP